MAKEHEVDFIGIEEYNEKGQEKDTSPVEDLDDIDKDEKTTDEKVETTDDKTVEITAEDIVDADKDKTTNTEEEEIPLVKELATQLGYEFEEEFEDTPEGIGQLVRKGAEKMAEQFIDDYFEQQPVAKNLYEYLAAGGDPDKFIKTVFPEIDYNKIELTDDERQQEQIVSAELRLKGYSNEDIQAEIEDFKTGGILENKAKRALGTLKKHQETERANLIKRQEEDNQKAFEEAENFWNGINQTITKSTQFKGFKIPEVDKSKFFDYLSKPVKDGKSQRDLSVEQADVETRLAIDYLLYKGFNINDLVAKKAKDNQAKSLRERLKRGNVSTQPAQRTGSVELADFN